MSISQSNQGNNLFQLINERNINGITLNEGTNVVSFDVEITSIEILDIPNQNTINIDALSEPIKIKGSIINHESIFKYYNQVSVELYDLDAPNTLIAKSLVSNVGEFNFIIDLAGFDSNLETLNNNLSFKLKYNDTEIEQLTRPYFDFSSEDSIEAYLEANLNDQTSPFASNVVFQGQISNQELNLVYTELTIRFFTIGLDNETFITSTTLNPDFTFTKEFFLPSIQNLLLAKVYGYNGQLVGKSNLTSIITLKHAETDKENLRKVNFDFNFETPAPVILPEWTRFNLILKRMFGVLDALELNDNNLEYISQKTGIPSSTTRFLLLSKRTYTAMPIEHEILFGLFRMGLPISISDLSQEDSDNVQSRLDSAIQFNIINESSVNNTIVNNTKEAIENELSSNILETNFFETNLSLNDILTISNTLNSTQKMEFAELFEKNVNNPQAFWETIVTRISGITAPTIEKLKFTFQASTVAMGTPAFTSAFYELLDNSTVDDFSGFASWTTSNWTSFIDAVITANGGDDVFPSQVPGANLTAKKNAYAKALSRIIEHSYPLDSLSARLAASSHPIAPNLATFKTNNPNFRLGQDKLDTYKVANPNALNGISDPSDFEDALKGLQLRYLMSPGFDKDKSINALEEIGVRSSADISEMGWENFSSGFVAAGGSLEIAGATYEMATKNLAFLQNMRFKYGIDLNLQTAATSGYDSLQERVRDLITSDPTLANLFGSQDFCECKHCRSIYSPSAYLTDTLQFLDRIKTTTVGVTALDVFFKRRKDICSILLNCENAETPLPYVDLLNEILEHGVKRVIDFGSNPGNNHPNDYSFYQTRGTAAELNAHPEHIRSEVYGTTLKEAVFPWKLPFDLFTQTGRTYLRHLKITRAELIRSFLDIALDEGEDERTAYANPVFVQEELELTTSEYLFLTDESAKTQRELWGLGGSENVVSTLKNVNTLLKKSERSFDQLKELLKSRYLNPFVSGKGYLSVLFASEDPCNLEEAQLVYRLGNTVTNLSQEVYTGNAITTLGDIDVFRRIMRFERLRVKIGWTIKELDAAFETFANSLGTDVNHTGRFITSEFLKNVACARLVIKQVKKPVIQILAFWNNIYTGHPLDDSKTISLYNSLFQNKMVLNPTDAAFKLNEQRNELDVTSEFIADHIPVIRAATGLKTEFLEFIQLGASPSLNLANLSKIYRSTLLAGILKTDLKTLYDFIDLINIDPFGLPSEDGFSPENTLYFLRLFQLAKSKKISTPQLKYLQKSAAISNEGIAPSDADTVKFLESLLSGLEKIKNSNLLEADPTGDLTRQKLTMITQSASEVESAINFIKTDSDGSNAPELILRFISQEEINEDESFELVTSPTPINVAARFALIYPKLIAYLIETQSTDYLIQSFSDQFKIEAEQSRFMLQYPELLTYVEGISTINTKIGDFLKDTSNYELTGTQTFADITVGKAYRLSAKIAAIITLLKLDSAELHFVMKGSNEEGWFGQNATWAGYINPALLTVNSGDQDYASLSLKLLELLEFLNLSRKFKTSDKKLYEIILRFNGSSDPAKYTQFITDLSAITNWNADDIAILQTCFTFEPNHPKLNQLPLYLFLEQAMRMISLTGSSAEEITDATNGWVNPEITFESSKSIVNSIKSLNDESRWPAIAKQLQDILRELQRDALSTYLVFVQYGIDSTNDLYAYYLIDPEMGACTISSRIRLAMSAVQLFAQRCQLNLEIEVGTSAENQEEWEEWKWMKRYRVWEANRKVFTYPENWIEPELRDDKTDFFKELEEELAQVDLTKSNIEKAYLNYLNKLEGVSTMDILGICNANEADTETKDSFYVFGRKKGKPTFLYFRKRSLNGYWTAWKKIDMDFEGDHLIPIVFNHKLMIFWPIFLWKGFKDGDGNPPKKLAQIQLAWSEFDNGKWSARRISDGKLLETDSWLHYDKNNLNDVGGEGRFLFVKQIKKVGNDEKLLIQVLHTDYGMADKLNKRPPPPEYHRKGRFGYFEMNTSKNISVVAEEGDPWQFFFSFAPHSDDQTTLTNYQWITSIPYKEIPNKEKLSIHSNNILKKIPNPEKGFTLLYVMDCPLPSPNDYGQDLKPMVLNDGERTYYITRTGNPSGGNYRFENLYHPFISNFIKVINRDGIETFLNPLSMSGAMADQLLNGLVNQQVYEDDFKSRYDPITPTTDQPYPVRDIDFSFEGSYSIYNWELFFHIPMYIAGKLSQNQQFEQAQHWYHKVFDPTSSNTSLAAPARYWKVKPFVETYSLTDGTPANVQELMTLLNGGDSNMESQVTVWRNNPFNPHAIARLRTTAYQKNVVMKYIDNLLSWGDMLFRQDTIESNNEAAQLYLLASEILGERPRKVDGKEPEDKSYCELKSIGLDDFSNAMVNLEYTFFNSISAQYLPKLEIFKKVIGFPTAIPVLPEGNTGIFKGSLGLVNAQEAVSENRKAIARPITAIAALPFHAPGDVLEKVYTVNNAVITHAPKYYRNNYRITTGLYFCIPSNDKLIGYWGFVADRMYKLRHCLDIEGRFRQLALFDPPIDPAMLVRAAAAGLDISSVLNDLYAPLSNYRFSYTVAKAKELNNLVKSLGQSLLSAIEKRDAESMALLRAVHEQEMLKAMTQMKKNQIKEAEANLDAANENLNMADKKFNYYNGREKMIDKEKMQIGLTSAGLVLETTVFGIQLASVINYLIPNGTLGGSGVASPVLTAQYGGQNLGPSSAFAASALSTTAKLLYQAASISGIMASFDRRQQEWDFQKDLATTEINMINKQIAAADIRKQIAEIDLENHTTTIEQKGAEFDFMRSKFSNEALYNWMITQLSATYFQTYNMAYSLAKQAEKTYRFELPDSPDDSFITFGYWDSLKKGLLAGDKLEKDLLRMETAYMEKNVRTYELNKNVSLAMLSPSSILELRETGTCQFSFPEELFDLDHPGHYLRRIKSVSISIPSVTGPYTGVHATLTLQSSEIRTTAIHPSPYPKDPSNEDGRFIIQRAAVQAIATSSGQNDSGMFNLNFNDERYLPFEGAGVISTWLLTLPDQFRLFDYDTISDVIITLNYTAKEGGEVLKQAAVGNLTTFVSESEEEPLLLSRLFSMKHEFGNEWYQFTHPVVNVNHQTTIELTKKNFPFYLNKLAITASKLNFYRKRNSPGGNLTTPLIDNLTVTVNEQEATTAAAGSAFSVFINEFPDLELLTFTLSPITSVLNGTNNTLTIEIEASQADVWKQFSDDLFIEVIYKATS
jgi:hypothetical protein